MLSMEDLARDGISMRDMRRRRRKTKKKEEEGEEQEEEEKEEKKEWRAGQRQGCNNNDYTCQNGPANQARKSSLAKCLQ